MRSKSRIIIFSNMDNKYERRNYKNDGIILLTYQPLHKKTLIVRCLGLIKHLI